MTTDISLCGTCGGTGKHEISGMDNMDVMEVTCGECNGRGRFMCTTYIGGKTRTNCEKPATHMVVQPYSPLTPPFYACTTHANAWDRKPGYRALYLGD